MRQGFGAGCNNMIRTRRAMEAAVRLLCKPYQVRVEGFGVMV